jgi:hypothetical protein
LRHNITYAQRAVEQTVSMALRTALADPQSALARHIDRAADRAATQVSLLLLLLLLLTCDHQIHSMRVL